MHNRHIGRLSRQKRQQHRHHPILRMRVKGASTMFCFASWVIYVPTGCRHPFIRYWQPLPEKLQRHGPCRILGRSVNGASMIFCVVSCEIYVPISCRHLFTRYWQPSLGKTTVTCSLPHAESEHRCSVNDCQLRILGNSCSDWLEIPI